MRVVRLASLLALSSVVGLVGCSSDPEPTPTTPPVTNQHPATTPQPPAHVDADPLDARPILACGPADTGSHIFAHELQEQGRDANVKLSILPAPDSLDVLYLVHLGYADIGVVHADVLLSPLHATARASLDVLRPIGIDPLRVLVKQDSPAKTLADLDGKKVALGPLGSSAATAGREVLIAGGLDPDAMDVRHLDAKEGLEALGHGDVDAVLLLGAPPTNMTQLVVARPLPLTDDEVAAIKTRCPCYVAQETGVAGGKTIGVPVVLVARKGADTQKVREFVETLFAQDPGAAALVQAVGPSLTTPIDGPSMEFRAEGKPLRIVSAGTGERTPAALLARAAKAGGAGEMQALSSHGAVESLALLTSGQVDLAVVPEALVQELLADPLTAPLVARVRLVAPLWTTPVVFSPATADGADLAAVLKGKSIVIGEPGSTRAVVGHHVLRMAGVDRADVTIRTAMPADYELRIEDAPHGVVDQSRAVLLGRVDLTPAQVESLVRVIFSNRKNLAAIDAAWGKLDPAALVAPAQGLKAHDGMLAAGPGVTCDDAPSW
jgi:TRAP-type uncharacterized transport system substrate-binding protein